MTEVYGGQMRNLGCVKNALAINPKGNFDTDPTLSPHGFPMSATTPDFSAAGDETSARETVDRIVAEAKRQGRLNLLETEAKQVCLAYGIDTPRFELARSREEAVSCAEQIGRPSY